MLRRPRTLSQGFGHRVSACKMFSWEDEAPAEPRRESLCPSITNCSLRRCISALPSGWQAVPCSPAAPRECRPPKSLFLTLTLSLISLVFTGCEQPPAPPAAAADPAASAVDEPSTAVVEGRAYEDTVDLPGASVRGYESTEIYAKLGGYITEIGKVDDDVIDLGTRVEEGALLAVLDVPEMMDEMTEKRASINQASSAVAQAEAAIAEAHAERLQREAELKQVEARREEKQAMVSLNKTKFQRVSTLANRGTIGQDSVDETKFAVEAAKAALASLDADVTAAQKQIEASTAKIKKAEADRDHALAHVELAKAILARSTTMMDYCKITAPFAGVVTERNIDHGTFVLPAERNSAAMPLFEVTRTDRVRVVVGVPNNKVAYVDPGMEARLHSIGGLPGRSFVGTVTRSAGALDEKSRTMRIEVELENPVTDERTGEQINLKPGLFGTLTIVRQKWREDSPIAVIPTNAIATDEHGVTYVVVKEGEQSERRDVVVAFNDAISVGISSGVEIGESVLTGGLDEY